MNCSSFRLDCVLARRHWSFDGLAFWVFGSLGCINTRALCERGMRFLGFINTIDSFSRRKIDRERCACVKLLAFQGIVVAKHRRWSPGSDGCCVAFVTVKSCWMAAFASKALFYWVTRLPSSPSPGTSYLFDMPFLRPEALPPHTETVNPEAPK